MEQARTLVVTFAVRIGNPRLRAPFVAQYNGAEAICSDTRYAVGVWTTHTTTCANPAKRPLLLCIRRSRVWREISPPAG